MICEVIRQSDISYSPHGIPYRRVLGMAYHDDMRFHHWFVTRQVARQNRIPPGDCFDWRRFRNVHEAIVFFSTGVRRRSW